MSAKKELIEKLEDWQYLKQLPKSVDKFILTVDVKGAGETIAIFSYEAADLRRKLTCCYNCTTKDYMVRKFVGFNEFYDIQFITPDFAEFEKILHLHLLECLEQLASFANEKSSHVLSSKGLLSWEYGANMPIRIADFELYISPNEPVRFNNGLIIVIDYSDFSTGNQLVIYYNELRDNFYAEKVALGAIHTTTSFDAKDLKDLEILLESDLEPYLVGFTV